MVKSNLQFWYKLANVIVDNEDCSIWWKGENETFAVRTSKRVKQFPSNKVYTLRKNYDVSIDIIKGQWRAFDRAVAFGFKKTHFYTALKWTHIHSTFGKRCTRNISFDYASVERAYSVTDVWGYYGYRFMLNRGKMAASPSKPWN